jgi:hypothetical protein
MQSHANSRHYSMRIFGRQSGRFGIQASEEELEDVVAQVLHN